MRIPDGKYEALARDTIMGEAKTGTASVNIEFEIVDESEARGKKIVWYGYLTDAAAKRTLESMRNAGWIGKSLDDLTFDPQRRCQIVVEAEEYEGKTRARVKWVNRLGGLGEPMDTSKAKGIAKKFGALIAEVDADIGFKRPGAAAAAPARAPSTSTEKPPF